MNRKSVKLVSSVLLLPLLLSLTACATTSPVCVTNSVSYPEMPLLSEPIPSVSYSLNAQTNTRAWRQKLTATPLTSAP